MNVLCYEKNILIGFLISFSKLFEMLMKAMMMVIVMGMRMPTVKYEEAAFTYYEFIMTVLFCCCTYTECERWEEIKSRWCLFWWYTLYRRYVFTFASACNRLAHNSLWFSFHFSTSTSRDCEMKVSQLLIWLSATLIIQMNALVMVYTSILLCCSFSIHSALREQLSRVAGWNYNARTHEKLIHCFGDNTSCIPQRVEN